MSDIPRSTINMGEWDEEAYCKEFGFKEPKESLKLLQTNLCVSHKTLERICTLGSQSDLSHLRQLDQKYYKTINPTFLDSMNKCLTICYPDGDARGLRDCTASQGFEAFVKEGEEYKEITAQNLTEKIFHIFRKLEYENLTIEDLRRTQSFLYGIYSQVAPYITSLRLNTIRLQRKRFGKNLAEFLNEFTSLKNLDLDYIFWYFPYSREKPMLLDQLEIGLANLQLKPQIKLYANCNKGHKEILKTFGNKENMSFELEFGFGCFGEPNDIEDFENLVMEYGTLPNIKYNISMYDGSFSNLTEMESFTKICLLLDSKIKKFQLTLEFRESSNEFEIDDQLGIKNCLAQMSPYVNDMRITQEMKPPWDILPHDSEWPHLVELWIDGYGHPLGMLKNCSKLEGLGLDVDHDLCFFSNSQQTEKENLLEYFGNLGQLTKLTVTREEKAGDKIVEGNELHKYFETILPKLKKIEYRSPRQYYFKK